MRRRDFITLLGGAATAWPLTARAQVRGRLATIGYLGGTTPANEGAYTAAFLQRLGELGWVEGRNLVVEYRWGEGRSEIVAGLVAELVRQKVDVILTTGNEFSLEAKRVTSVIPIVFAIAGDPVGTGLVASLARPGSNVTGLAAQLTDGAGKRVELLRELVPGLRRLAIMAHVNPLQVRESAAAQAAAKTLGLEVITVDVRQEEDIALGFDSFRDRVNALYVSNSTFLAAHERQIATAALEARLPTMFASRSWIDAGGLISFGASFVERFRRSANLVDKILRGTKPADIPVEQPTTFELVINLKTAKALGLMVPPALLARADEVIE
jgi:putative tryptophan/tyrosine transport system substrate-binding protein